MKKLLPQANNLDTLIKVFIYFGNKNECSIQDLADFIGFEFRQAQYYLSACIYLDLIDETPKLTEFGRSLFEDPITIKYKIYERIISDDVIGKVFAHLLLFNDDVKNYSFEIVKKYYPNYSDAVIERRASTIKNWCEKILKEVYYRRNN